MNAQQLQIPQAQGSETSKTAYAAPCAVLDESLQDLPVHWVGNEDVLYALIDEIDSIDRVALDTEFIKRSTYFPILALVQVNTGRAIYLIDAPRLDLSEFWQALAEVPEMIWYACGEDLAIFYLLSGCPPLNNVVDIQIGMAYLTGSLQMGYARALDTVFGLKLAKSESQSDWRHRPLSNEQMCYAADDVRYLLALHDVVAGELKTRGIKAYVDEDTQHHVNELHRAQNQADEEAYLEWVAPIYTQVQLAALKEIVAWREKLARSTNRPRSFIISRQALREIVLSMPTSVKLLARTTIHRSSLRMYGDEVVAMIKSVLTLTDDVLPPMPAPKYNIRDKSLKNKLKAVIATEADKLGVPDVLLLKNRWVSELCLLALSKDGVVAAPKLSDALKGYRYSWVISDVVPLLYEHRAVLTLAEDESKGDD